MEGSFQFFIRQSINYILDLYSREKEFIILDEMKNIGCLNQSQLIVYFFNAINLHKRLRDTNKDNVQDIHICYQELIKHLNDGLRTAIIKNCIWASNLFKITAHRNNIVRPRCGVKTLIGKTNEDAEVVSLWGTMAYTEGTSHKLTENSATLEAFKNPRQSFLQNDIPKSIINGDYKHPQIDREKTEQYVKKIFPPYFYRKKLENDHDWRRCWIPNDKSVVYKSTLVTPIAFNTNQYPDFERRFINQWTIALDIENLLQGHNIKDNLFCFGYFCVDHPKANYFDERRDNNIGYFIADFLYYYFYIYYTFTRLSHTCQKYIERDSLQDNKSFT